MKRVPLGLLLVLATNVDADPDPIHLHPVLLGSAPTLAKGDEQSCDSDAADRIATQSRVVGTARVTVLHDCGSEAETVLAIHTGDRWFSSMLTTIAYQGANMSDAPLHITLLDERLVTGTLADGTPAVAHIASTLHRAITGCHSEPCTQEVRSAATYGRVQVCTTDDEPACGDVLLTCPAKGCAAPRLSRGTLTVVDSELGTLRIPIKRERGPAPPP